MLFCFKLFCKDAEDCVNFVFGGFFTLHVFLFDFVMGMGWLLFYTANRSLHTFNLIKFMCIVLTARKFGTTANALIGWMLSIKKEKKITGQTVTLSFKLGIWHEPRQEILLFILNTLTV